MEETDNFKVHYIDYENTVKENNHWLQYHIRVVSKHDTLKKAKEFTRKEYPTTGIRYFIIQDRSKKILYCFDAKQQFCIGSIAVGGYDKHLVKLLKERD